MTYTMTVTWMDGPQEVYTVNTFKVADDQLYLTESGSYASRDDLRVIPLRNVRVWKAERR